MGLMSARECFQNGPFVVYIPLPIKRPVVGNRSDSNPKLWKSNEWIDWRFFGSIVLMVVVPKRELWDVGPQWRWRYCECSAKRCACAYFTFRRLCGISLAPSITNLPCEYMCIHSCLILILSICFFVAICLILAQGFHFILLVRRFDYVEHMRWLGRLQISLLKDQRASTRVALHVNKENGDAKRESKSETNNYIIATLRA